MIAEAIKERLPQKELRGSSVDRIADAVAVKSTARRRCGRDDFYSSRPSRSTSLFGHHLLRKLSGPAAGSCSSARFEGRDRTPPDVTARPTARQHSAQRSPSQTSPRDRSAHNQGRRDSAPGPATRPPRRAHIMPERASSRARAGRRSSAPEPQAYHDSARRTQHLADHRDQRPRRQPGLRRTPVAKAVEGADQPRVPAFRRRRDSARIDHSVASPSTAGRPARRRPGPTPIARITTRNEKRRRRGRGREGRPRRRPSLSAPIRGAPSRRIEQLVILSYSTIARTSAAYSSAQQEHRRKRRRSPQELFRNPRHALEHRRVEEPGHDRTDTRYRSPKDHRRPAASGQENTALRGSIGRLPRSARTSSADRGGADDDAAAAVPASRAQARHRDHGFAVMWMRFRRFTSDGAA